MMPDSAQAAAFRANLEPQAIVRRQDGSVVDASRGWLVHFGLDHEDTVGHTLPELEIFADAASQRRFQVALERSDGMEDAEFALRDRGGGVTRGRVTVDPLPSQPECCLVVVRDNVPVSEMSATLAHELNQPLAAIMANALAGLRFMDRDPIDTAELRSLLQDIVADDRRATEIIHRLRAFLRHGVE